MIDSITNTSVYTFYLGHLDRELRDSGLKLFRTNDTLRDVFAQPFLSRWIFDVEIIARYVERLGRDAVAGAIYELPVMRWHDVKGSKVKSFDFLRALHDLWKIRRAYRRSLQG